jgi:segregation and condensation protein B
MELTSEMQNEVDSADEIKNLKKVEAALFIAGRFLSLQELITLTDINPLLLRELIEKLIDKYDENSAIEILKQEGERWKMDVRAEHRNIVNRLATGTAEFSKAEQETLAVIAYKQPVKQSVIINIRGNKAYDHIHHFIEIGLVRGKRIGHTKELNLSEDFYDYFSLGKKGAEGQEKEEGGQEGEWPQIKESGKDEVKSKASEEDITQESLERELTAEKPVLQDNNL